MIVIKQSNDVIALFIVFIIFIITLFCLAVVLVIRWCLFYEEIVAALKTQYFC